jgi:hypothetical protein
VVKVSKKEESYIDFELVEQKPKTNVFDVKNKHHGTKLGTVKWHSEWRQYAFFPEPEMVFSQGCMEDITKFVNGLMEERKKKV